MITMDKLTVTMCRWPSGDPRDDEFQFCGDRCAAHLSYCDAHMLLAHGSGASSRSHGQRKKTA